jgi:hypothetical protein
LRTSSIVRDIVVWALDNIRAGCYRVRLISDESRGVPAERHDGFFCNSGQKRSDPSCSIAIKGAINQTSTHIKYSKRENNQYSQSDRAYMFCRLWNTKGTLRGLKVNWLDRNRVQVREDPRRGNEYFTLQQPFRLLSSSEVRSLELCLHLFSEMNRIPGKQSRQYRNDFHLCKSIALMLDREII